MYRSTIANIALAAGLSGGLASANDLNVPSAQYPTIQDALDSAVSGDRILLAAGAHTGPRNCDLDPLGKDLQILGAGAGVTVLDVQATFWDEHTGFAIAAGGPGLVIEGLTIQSGYRDEGAAVLVSGSAAPRFVNCVFTANATWAWGGAVCATDWAAPSFEGCTFDNNYSVLGGAVWVDGAASPTFANCTFTLNQGIDSGGVVCIDAASATFDGCSFLANNAVSYGGAVALYSGAQASFANTAFGQNFTHSLNGGAIWAQDAGTRATLSACTFVANSANSGGAIAMLSSAELVASASTFESNVAGYGGGALDMASGATATLSSCTLRLNTTQGYGGGASIRDHSLATLDQCTLEQNQAQSSGGGMEVSYFSNVALTGCTLRDNGTPAQGGGAYVADSSSLTIAGGQFANNSAWSGGGVHLWDDSSLACDGVSFDDNHATSEGGGVRIDGWDSTSMVAGLTSCAFTFNDAALGGAIFANDAATVTVSACTLDQNAAVVDGGGLYGTATSLFVTGGGITSNTAGDFGGGVMLAGGGSVFQDVSLVTNTAGIDGGAVQVWTPSTVASFERCEVTHNQAASRGGGISIADAQGVPLLDCHVYENSAAVGGAIAVWNGANVTLTQVVVEANHASQLGAAVSVDTNAFLTAVRCAFLTNDSQQSGGGLAFDGADGALRWCRVESNLAASSGGGFLLTGNAFVRVQGSQVRGNVAAHGAGFYAEGSSRPVVSCSTVIDNQASGSGGGFEFLTPNLILANSILWGNVPESLHDGGGGGAIVNYCDVQGGWTGTGNLDADPLLVFAYGAYFVPSVGSPCIDAGDNSRVPPLITVDVLDRPRLIDDPWTPDTGAGTPPLVDLGAVEFRHEPVGYCVGRVNSQGCTPAISYAGVAIGWPNACTEAPFRIYGFDVINNTDGILFFGLSGRNSLPWKGGTLCVRQPIRRTPLVNSGGNPPPDDCSGGFAFEFSEWACEDSLFVPGTMINAQWWGRDPAQTGPFQVQLSNAIEFVLN